MVLPTYLENVSPETNYRRYRCDNNSFDDEQRSYFSSSAPDYVKHKRVCQETMIALMTIALKKRMFGKMSAYTVLLLQLQSYSIPRNILVAQLGISLILHIPVINVPSK
jgi:hypothetical protein